MNNFTANVILYVYLGLMGFVQKDIQALIHLHIENYITQWQFFICNIY